MVFAYRVDEKEKNSGMCAFEAPQLFSKVCTDREERFPTSGNTGLHAGEQSAPKSTSYSRQSLLWT